MYQIYLKYLLLHVPRPFCPLLVSFVFLDSLALVSCINTYMILCISRKTYVPDKR